MAEPGRNGVFAGGGQSGTDGAMCWDLNGNGVGDPAEDTNGDGTVDAQDCPGASGPAGDSGSSGAAGPAGRSLFEIFIDDFFAAAGTGNGDLVVNVVSISEPVLGVDLDRTAGQLVDAVAYRVAVPQMYDAGNDVTMRLFFERSGPFLGDCFIFTLDARRLRAGPGTSFAGEVVDARVFLDAPFELADGSALWATDHYGLIVELRLFP